jgi:predicted nucleotidyltransferase
MVNLSRLLFVLGRNLGDEMPIRQLSKESGVPYTTAYRLIMREEGLFTINQKGNIKLVSLNLEDDIVKHHLIISERREAEAFLKKQPMFKILKDDLPAGDYSLLLFGSRVEGSDRKKSDVDLCLISRTGNRVVRFSKLELIFKLDINCLYLKDKEFSEMIESNDHNVGKEILKKHILIYGEEHFWNLAWHSKN